jgi:hypothetical protein
MTRQHRSNITLFDKSSVCAVLTVAAVVEW